MIRVSLCDNSDDRTRMRDRKGEKERGWTSDQRPIKMRGASPCPVPTVEAFGDARCTHPGGHLHAVALNHRRNNI